MCSNKQYYHDYPTEPIGGGNPYYRCIYCKTSDPEINGQLENHDSHCEYRIEKEIELGLRAPEVCEQSSIDDYFHDYPTEPIGGGNPYSRCVYCHWSAPEINGRIDGHAEDCDYRIKKEKALGIRE